MDRFSEDFVAELFMVCYGGGDTMDQIFDSPVDEPHHSRPQLPC